jgi:hypothetical protein
MLKKSNVRQNNQHALDINELPADRLSLISGGLGTGIIIVPPKPPCPDPDFDME